QQLANTSPEQAAALIEAAGMKVGQVPSYDKPVLSATQRHPSSAVQLLANVGVLTAKTFGKVFFNWQYSGDGGESWIARPSTPRGKADLEGLTPMETYGFRVSVTDTNG